MAERGQFEFRRILGTVACEAVNMPGVYTRD